MMRLFGRRLPHWKDLTVILGPLLLLPLPLISGTMEARCAYVVLVMSVYWMTEAVPLPVTALIPVFGFPLLGVVNTTQIAKQYVTKSSMMFMGGLMMAITVENCNLHKRIALHVLIWMGTRIRWLMLGLMLTAMGLSMWVSNTATTAMMVSIVDALLFDLYDVHRESLSISMAEAWENAHEEGRSRSNTGHNSVEKQEEIKLRPKVSYEKLRKCFFLALAYSANIGGTGTFNGTSTNLVFRGMLTKIYGEDTELNFGTWMFFSIPQMLINTLLAWIWLQIYFLWGEGAGEKHERIGKILRAKLKAMGSLTFHEGSVLTIFAVTVSLWLTRNPPIFTGWGRYINGGGFVDDPTIGILSVFTMFILPANFRRNDSEKSGPSKKLVTWEIVQQKMPWGIVLLMGGGFAIAEGCEQSGLSDWLSNKLSLLEVLPSWAIVLVVCIMTAMITEVASNSATCTILMPVLAKMSEAIGVNPLYMMLPAAFTCSYAFMLPVATAPNAVAYDASKMQPMDMIKPGAVMNIVCVLVIFFIINTLGVVMFDLHTYPVWAMRNTTI